MVGVAPLSNESIERAICRSIASPLQVYHGATGEFKLPLNMNIYIDTYIYIYMYLYIYIHIYIYIFNQSPKLRSI